MKHRPDFTHFVIELKGEVYGHETTTKELVGNHSQSVKAQGSLTARPKEKCGNTFTMIGDDTYHDLKLLAKKRITSSF
ncbi:hypothetical protein AB1K84_05280 [Mesobacillus foraminis]|uniref:hypothetical protein n=1 Tax=Mesobacillus foraminis TaxID=279826 RepID=UPI0039A07D14